MANKLWKDYTAAERVQYLGEAALAERLEPYSTLGTRQMYANSVALSLMPLIDRFVNNSYEIAIGEGVLPSTCGYVKFDGIRENNPLQQELQLAGFKDLFWRRGPFSGPKLMVGAGACLDSGPSSCIYEVEAMRHVLERLSPRNSRLGVVVPVTLNGELLTRDAPTPKHPLGSLKIKSVKVAVPV